jgi:hypothetical protein
MLNVSPCPRIRAEGCERQIIDRVQPVIVRLTCEQEVEPYDHEDREPADSEAIEVIRGIVAHFRACTVDP